MRIAYLTAGAAGMYCGSCLHDNTLARELRALGHDCLLIPLYTPVRTDEPDASISEVFFGGLSIYLEQKYPWFRRMPEALDRILSRPSLLRLLSGLAISSDARDLGSLTLSMLRGRRGYQALEIERLCRWLRGHFQPDVICLSNSLLSGLIESLHEQFRVPVVVFLQGEDLFLDALPDDAKRQACQLLQLNLSSAAGFIAPCEDYANYMSRYLQIPRDRMRVVYPGVHIQDLLRRMEPDARRADDSRQEHDPAARLRIGYLARIGPEKGLHVLIEACSLLRQMTEVPAWELSVAGYLPPSQRDYLQELCQRVQSEGWDDRLQFVGEVDRRGKVRFLHRLDVFSVPATYREPKGLYVFEAWAAGVPVVQPEHGIFAEVVPAAQAGLLVQPNSASALAAGLAKMLCDAHWRRQAGQNGRAFAAATGHAQRMAQDTLQALGYFLGSSLAASSSTGWGLRPANP